MMKNINKFHLILFKIKQIKNILFFFLLLNSID
jgi:hypothetical protein